jgi:hypothetical protein
MLAIAALSGTLLAWGAGNCLPYNFWSGLLGDTIIAGAVGTIVGNVAGGIGAPAAG